MNKRLVMIAAAVAALGGGLLVAGSMMQNARAAGGKYTQSDCEKKTECPFATGCDEEKTSCPK